MEDLPSEEILKVFRSIVDITACAVCLDPVRPEMVQCVNNHLLCAECQGDLDQCPTCRAEFSGTRPPAIVAQVFGALPPRCRHKNCGRYMKSGDNHEKFCGLKAATCRMEECNWSGTGQGVPEHIRQQHPNQTVYTETTGTHLIVVSDFDPQENSSVFIPHFIKGQFFWHEITNNVDNKLLLHKLHFVPNGKPEQQFYLKIFAVSQEMKFTFKIKLNLDPDATDEVNFFTIPQFLLHHFVDGQNNLSCNVSIKAK